MTKLYLVVDNNGRHGGAVHGIYATRGEALLAAANTPAHCSVFEMKVTDVSE